MKIILQLVQFHLNGSVIKLQVKFAFARPAASVVGWFKCQTRDLFVFKWKSSKSCKATGHEEEPLCGENQPGGENVVVRTFGFWDFFNASFQEATVLIFYPEGKSFHSSSDVKLK